VRKGKETRANSQKMATNTHKREGRTGIMTISLLDKQIIRSQTDSQGYRRSKHMIDNN